MTCTREGGAGVGKGKYGEKTEGKQEDETKEEEDGEKTVAEM